MTSTTATPHRRERFRPALVALLVEQRDWTARQIEFLVHNHDALTHHIDAAGQTLAS